MRSAIVFFVVAAACSTANAQTYPNHKLTPGVVDSSVTVKNLCTPGYTASIRLVTDATRKKVMLRYGLDPADLGLYEVDHFISLEIGGKNDIENLWPQQWKSPGAREKDVVETALHRRICKGELSILQAQGVIKKDWYAAYVKLKSAR
jgi:hypothetical protein